MESWPNAFAFFLLYWWGGVAFGCCLHFTVFYLSAKYASAFDAHH